MGENRDIKITIKEKLASVNLSDGVDKEEAIVIAQNYLIDNGLDALLDVSKVRKTDDQKSPWGIEDWLISFSTTSKARRQQGLKWGSLLVNKKTGVVKYLGEGPDL